LSRGVTVVIAAHADLLVGLTEGVEGVIRGVFH